MCATTPSSRESIFICKYKTNQTKKNPEVTNPHKNFFASRVWWRTLVIPVLGRLREEDQRLKASLSNLVRPCFKIKNKKGVGKPGVVAHTCNPSAWEAETGGLQVHSQPQLLSEALPNLVRPCFKIKIKGCFTQHHLQDIALM